MGFWNKLGNFLTGKGWKEKETIEDLEDMQEFTPQEQETIQETYAEEQPQQEPIQQPKEIHKPLPIKELEQAEKRVQKYQGVQHVNEHIERDTVNNVQLTALNTGIGDYRSAYNNLFDNKVADKEMREILIENRERLQHRFEATIIIHGTNGEAGRLSTKGVLPEHVQNIHDWFPEGQKTEYLERDLHAFQDMLTNNFASIGGTVTVTEQKTTISNVTVDVTFA